MATNPTTTDRAEEAQKTAAAADKRATAAEKRAGAKKDDAAGRQLQQGEQMMELPFGVRGSNQTEMRKVYFFKPKAGKWTLVTSSRNARQWHVLDTERAEGQDNPKVLCGIPLASWSGRQDADPKEQPITCPWCLTRMLHSGAVTDADQKKLTASLKEKQDAEAKRKRDEAAANRKTATAASTSTSSGSTRKTGSTRRRGNRKKSGAAPAASS